MTYFTKMHGLGNDFVIIDGIKHKIDINNLPITQLSNRHLGIGFDQLLIIEPTSSGADFFCRILNADGSEAEQCGNGLRCVARYIHENKLNQSNSFSIATKAGVFPVTIQDYDHITVTLSAPTIQQSLANVTIDNQEIPLSILSLGNPHAIMKVDSIDAISTNELAPKIAAQHFFPNGANVGFMQVLNNNHVRLRTYERGAGETLACGSNACAAIVAGKINGWLGNYVSVEFCLGKLLVEWEGENQPIRMTGPATKVFDGKI